MKKEEEGEAEEEEENLCKKLSKIIPERFIGKFVKIASIFVTLLRLSSELI